MGELILVVEPTRTSLIEALKTKIALENLGLAVVGAVMRLGEEEGIPLEFIEDILRLKILASMGGDTWN